MTHKFFYEVQPSLAETETRVIQVGDNEDGIPEGMYPVLEYFCTDPACDCRQVYLHILNDETQHFEAVVSFGWEPILFYQDWNFGKLDDVIRDFKGPALALGAFTQGRYAKEWLQYLKVWLSVDEDYIHRLERHYWLCKVAH